MNITSQTPNVMLPSSPRNLPGTLKDVLALSHIFNGLASAAAVGIGYLATAWFFDLPIELAPFLWAVLATLLISNGGFVINDILDLKIDRVNRPDRPLPSGRVSVGVAWGIYIAYTLLGILLACLVSLPLGVLAACIAAGLFLYSLRLKRMFLIGHLVIAILGGVLMPFGGMAAGNALLMLTFPVTFSAFLAREVLKTVPDVEGDRAHGVDNIATRYGPRKAMQVSQMMLAICAVLLPLMRLFWESNPWYLLLVAIVIWPLTAFFLIRLNRPPDAAYRQVNIVLRGSKMLFLLVALSILIGSL